MSKLNNELLIRSSKSLVRQSLLADVTELFLDLLTCDRYAPLIVPELDGKQVYQYWIIDPSYAALIVAQHPDEIIFLFYDVLIWARQSAGQDIHRDPIFIDLARKFSSKVKELIEEPYSVLGEK